MGPHPVSLLRTNSLTACEKVSPTRYNVRVVVTDPQGQQGVGVKCKLCQPERVKSVKLPT